MMKIDYIEKYCYLCQANNCRGCPIMSLLNRQEGNFGKLAGQALNKIFDKLINYEYKKE